jgi:protocatechuate 3,4-dioxygenase beta subunit
MQRILLILVATSIIISTTACSNSQTPTEAQTFPTAEIVTNATPLLPPTPDSVPETAAPTPAAPAASDDFFTQNGIVLPDPVCAGLTQPQTEGPYYTPNTPERNSLLEEGMPGARLILVGYVLDQNCLPLANAWLDFWQADTNGEYDNSGYRLRGHQFTDAQGRYYLETVLPGLYQSRPIEHIHVKVRPEGGAEVTSQLYFPNQPIAGLTVTLEERGDHFVGYFNFVVQR